MWERNHHDIIETLDKSEAITELAIIDYISLATHSRSKLIPVHFTIQETVDIIDIEATWLERRLWFIFVSFGVLSRVLKCWSRKNRITNGVKVTLVNLDAASDIETFKHEAGSVVLVVENCKPILGYHGQRVHILSKVGCD